MGKLVSGITDAIGLTNNKGKRRETEALQNAARASNNANALSKENLDFQKEQYNDWKAIYGELQENLGDYYKGLGTEKITSLGLQAQQQAHQNAQQQIQQNLAQRGLGDSKFEAYTLNQSEVNNSNVRAQIRATAEEKAAQQKSGFLGIGLGQGTQLLGNVGNAANIGVNAFTNQAGMYTNQFTTLANNNAAFLRQSTSNNDTVRSDVGSAFKMWSDRNVKFNIAKVGELQEHNIYSFEFKNKPGTMHIGVIAQEIEKVRPDVVSIKNGIRFVDYQKLFGDDVNLIIGE